MLKILLRDGPGLGMARGIPRPSFLEVPDLFPLLEPRGIDSSTPRILDPRQNFLEDLEDKLLANANYLQLQSLKPDVR